MKKFLIDLLILLSTPLYVIAVIVFAIISVLLRCSETIGDFVSNAIEFMKSDYIDLFDFIKKYFKRGK